MDVAAAPYGLPIPSSSSSAAVEEVDDAAMIGQLAYFSNSPLNSDESSSSSDKTQQHHHSVAIIGIHGSGRDACAMFHRLMTTVKQHIGGGCDGFRSNDTDSNKSYDENLTATMLTAEQDDILVITPWFLCPADDCPSPPSSHDNKRSLPYLRWIDDPIGPLQIEHSFRYGAESIPPINNDDDIITDDTTIKNNATVSSYFVMDILIETLCNRSKYPSLTKIIIVGHSAGGQLVHRWGLMSGSWCFGQNDDDTDFFGRLTKTDNDITALITDDVRNSIPSIRLVVANPRSFTYLDRRRYYLPNTPTPSANNNDDYNQDDNALEFRLPTNSELEACPYYNRYMWGIEDNPDLPTPYITNNIERLMKNVKHSHCDSSVTTITEALFCRYANRDVVYLAGENDTQIVEEQISCGDGYQGQMRRDRSERYYASLQLIGKEILSRRRQDVTMGKDVEWSRFMTRFHSTHTEGEEIRIHRRLVVKNVGHEGGRMWKSEEGRIGMFETD